jgi:hypothetical protein
MEQLLRQRITIVWLGLVLATLLSWALSSEHVFDSSIARTVTTMAILGVALVKVRFVGLDFMEIRHAPRALRLALDVWMLGVYGMLVGLYVFH